MRDEANSIVHTSNLLMDIKSQPAKAEMSEPKILNLLPTDLFII